MTGANRLHRIPGLMLLAALTSACALLRPAGVPIGSEYFHYEPSNSTLVVLLHGRGGKATTFVKYGAVDQIRACHPGTNILGVDSHFGYYRERIIEQRLRQDIIGPALKNGIDRVWILGISVGGLGGLVYRQNYPDDIEAVVMMAPYLGDWDELSAYLTTPPSAHDRLDPEFVDIWNRLSSTVNEPPWLTLAFADDDGFSHQHRWLAGLLGSERVASGPGGHNWNAWRKLWPEALQRSGLCNRV